MSDFTKMFDEWCQANSELIGWTNIEELKKNFKKVDASNRVAVDVLNAKVQKLIAQNKELDSIFRSKNNELNIINEQLNYIKSKYDILKSDYDVLKLDFDMWKYVKGIE